MVRVRVRDRARGRGRVQRESVAANLCRRECQRFLCGQVRGRDWRAAGSPRGATCFAPDLGSRVGSSVGSGRQEGLGEAGALRRGRRRFSPLLLSPQLIPYLVRVRVRAKA